MTACLPLSRNLYKKLVDDRGDDRGVETRNTYHSPIEVPLKIEHVSKFEYSADDAMCKSADEGH